MRGFAVGTVVVATMLSSLVLAGMVGTQGTAELQDDGTIPVLVEGFVMVPSDATSVTVVGGEDATSTAEITTSDVLNLPATGSSCAPPPAIAYRMYVTGEDTSVSWQVDGGQEDTNGVFADVPSNFLSADGGQSNDLDGDGSPDRLADHTQCEAQLARG